jgi:pimeloyl-ACP methyl ester carboxylesterase
MTAVEPKMHAQYPVLYKTLRVNDLDIFYREAGAHGAPVIRHGFPSSSNMFRSLIPRLAGSFRLVDPNYPGYGQSRMPEYKAFEFSFENLANVIDGFVESIGLSKYSMYVMDYGGPIGYRLALKHPERAQALIVQDGNAYVEGLLEFGDWQRSR